MRIKIEYEKTREKVLRFRYLDDAFMSVALNDKETIGEVLSIIMGKRLTVKTVQAQDAVLNLYGRGVRFDVFAEDEDGVLYDIEIQRAKEGADPKRIRFNAATMDSRLLKAGDEFTDLPNTCIIFITENDVLRDGLLIQHFHLVSDETGKQLQTGQEVIYVDSSCQPDTPLGNLMHDFHCCEAKDIRNKVLARRMERIKNDTVEVDRMCEVMEDYREEGRREGRKEGRREGRKEGRVEERITNIRALIDGGFSVEKIFDLLKIPESDRDSLRRQLAERSQ